LGGGHRISDVNVDPKRQKEKLRAQINGKLNDIISADENK
jgi:hypothetical protein